jgi:nucleotide-binding universal stress UspA family protein|nr:universal stress protein [uncultured Caldimonas sp.]
MKFERVLVPIDFSNDSINALQVALERLASPDATLILLNAVEQAAALDDEHLLLKSQMNSTLVNDTRERLLSLVSAHKDRWAEIHGIVEIGKAAQVILGVANSWNADVVVMGSHGTSSLTRTLFGGTTYHVARKLGCSVMIIKPSRKS